MRNGPYGNTHLAGNVWEYVADVWHPSVYSSKPRENPAGVEVGQVHVLRGGGWNTFSTNMRNANRFHDLVMGSASGFRCARAFSNSKYDDVEPLIFSSVSGSITSPRPLSGRALYYQHSLLLMPTQENAYTWSFSGSRSSFHPQ